MPPQGQRPTRHRSSCRRLGQRTKEERPTRVAFSFGTVLVYWWSNVTTMENELDHYEWEQLRLTIEELRKRIVDVRIMRDKRMATHKEGDDALFRCLDVSIRGLESARDACCASMNRSEELLAAHIAGR